MHIEILPEEPHDFDEVRQVHRLAFGQDAEGRLVDELRDLGHARLSLVARANEQVVGHILFCDLEMEPAGADLQSVALAPLAVLPEFQRQGIGSALVACGIEECRRIGLDLVVVVGDPAYYGRFGFSPALASRLDSPYAGEHCMALELRPLGESPARGRIKYPQPFEGF